MDVDVGHRRTQARLARQHPRQTSGQRTWIRVDWVKVGVIVTIVASVGGLLVTGIGTYYGALVAADQLAESQESARTKDRDQAKRITFWVTPDHKGHERMHFANRSPDPVTDISVHFIINAEFEDEPESATPIISFKYLAPCSEIKIDRDDLKKWDKGRVIPYGDRTSMAPMALVFTDANGKNWARTPWSLDNDVSNLPGITKIKPLGTKPLAGMRSTSPCGVAANP
ncbi:hypothetical protein ACFWZT_27740 [Streptomyces alboflavus]|uniref:hypothetical protein n=1 Tax=Streptomyces alboflavus TaxID=67267 RepID=UPI0036838B97